MSSEEFEQTSDIEEAEEESSELDQSSDDGSSSYQDDYGSEKSRVKAHYKEKIEEIMASERKKTIRRNLGGNSDDGEEIITARGAKKGRARKKKKKKEKPVTVILGPAMHKKGSWEGSALLSIHESTHGSEEEEEEEYLDIEEEHVGRSPAEVLRLRKRLLVQASGSGGGGGGGKRRRPSMDEPYAEDGLSEPRCWWCLFGDLSHDKVNAEACKVFLEIYEKYVVSLPSSQFAYLLYESWVKLFWAPSVKNGEEIPVMTPLMFITLILDLWWQSRSGTCAC